MTARESVALAYAFTPQRHAGFAPEEVVFLRWSATANAPFVAPEPKGTAQ